MLEKKYCEVLFFLEKVAEDRCKTLTCPYLSRISQLIMDLQWDEPERFNRFLCRKQKLYFTNYFRLPFVAVGGSGLGRKCDATVGLMLWHSW